LNRMCANSKLSQQRGSAHETVMSPVIPGEGICTLTGVGRDKATSRTHTLNSLRGRLVSTIQFSRVRESTHSWSQHDNQKLGTPVISDSSIGARLRRILYL